MRWVVRFFSQSATFIESAEVSVFFMNVADPSERNDGHFLLFLLNQVNCRVGPSDMYSIPVLVSFQFLLIPSASRIRVNCKKAECGGTLKILLIGKIVQNLICFWVQK